MGIEIYFTYLINIQASRHTPRGVWGLKCPEMIVRFITQLSYPARGMGIEIMTKLEDKKNDKSYPARGMGIEIEENRF